VLAVGLPDCFSLCAVFEDMFR